MLNDAVPVTELTSNFSPISDIAPPPFGKEITGRFGAPVDADRCVAPFVASGGIRVSFSRDQWASVR
jgi:hypothetical protein